MSFNCGIDFSITSPSMCFYNEKMDEYKIHAWTQTKKYKRPLTKIKNYSFIIHYIDRKEYPTNYSFYYKLVKEMIEWLITYKTKLVGIEEFAFGGSGKITILAECVGYLKFRYYEETKNQIIPIPISFGKMVGNEKMLGSASKYTNIKWFLENELNFLKRLNLNITDETPLSDIIDSINILRVIQYYNDYNNDIEIPEKLKKSFNKWKMNL